MPLNTYLPMLSFPGPEGERVVALDRETTSLGRSPGNDIVQAYPFVSRQHAVIERHGASYVVVDLKSTHGTYVNGEKIAGRTPLEPDDILQLGSLQAPALRFQLQFAEPQRNEDTPSMKDLLATLSGSLPATETNVRPAAREMGQLNFLLSAARVLNSGEAVEDILRALLQLTLQLTGVDRGFIFRYEDGEMRLAQGMRSDGSPVFEDSTVSRSAIRSAVESSSKFSVSDTLTNESASAWSSILSNHIRSIYCIPLRKRIKSSMSDSLLGLLYLDSQIGTGELCALDQELLDTIAAEAAVLLHSAVLAQEEAKARQAREELAIAARIHSGLMSIKLPSLPFATLNARTVPCLAIGGDFFDAIAIDDHLAITLADISGKGVSAAIVAATLQGIIHAQLMAGQSLVDVANLVNRFLCDRGVQKYATMFILKLYPDGKVEYLNCGHIPPVAVFEDEIHRLTEGSLVVGLIREATYRSHVYQLRPGERLLIATDGVTEAEDGNGECIGDAGLDHLARHSTLDEIISHVAAFQHPREAHDDCTVVDVRYHGIG